MHGVNFWSASLFFFIGTAFCLPWIVPKVLALIRGIEISTINIWVLLYFIIWVTYYFQGSIRYLSPIYVPFAILIVHGFYSLLEFFDIPLKAKLHRTVLLFFGCTNFYYLIPIDLAVLKEESQELIGVAYNKSAFFYYSHPEIIIIQAVIFSLTWMGFLILTSNNPIKSKITAIISLQGKKELFSTKNIHRLKIGLTSTFFLIVLMVPIVVQGYVWIQSSGNPETFQETIEYEYNEDYKAIVDHINQMGSITGAIITIRTPGLSFFTQHPVLDFYYQGNLLGEQIYSSHNLTYLIEVLKHPSVYLFPPEPDQSLSFKLSFEFIVVPNTGNIYFDIYIENIWSEVYFFRSLGNTTYFELLLKNDRYQLFRIK